MSLTPMRISVEFGYSARACMLFTDTHRVAMTVAKLMWTTTLLARLTGLKSLMTGLLASALVMPCSALLTKRYGITKAEQANIERERSGVLAAALLAVRQIKLASAEETWELRIQQLRDKELKHLLTGAVWLSLLVFVANISPVILAGVPIYIFTLQGYKLTASIAFTSISLFRQLQSDISYLPLITPYIWEAWMDLCRLEAFFAQDELDKTQVTPAKTVKLEKAAVTWHATGSKENKAFTLKDLSVQFPNGELSVITGNTGSGKSLLLAAIAGEARLLSGSIHRPCSSANSDIKADDTWISAGQMALVTQSPWMDNTTIRENILFGLPFDEERYARALHSCALKKDLATLKDGDSTLVGIKGVTLSGGQRWRVALARALYSRASLLLLDDVLSAVDAEVREWIVERALFGDLARGRTRILVTHHVSHCVARAACLVRLGDGKAQIQFRHPPPTDVPRQQDSRHVLADQVHLEDLSTAERKIDSSARKEAKQISSETLQKPLPSSYRTYFIATGGTPSWLLALLSATTCELVGLATAWWLKEWASQDKSRHYQERRVLSYGATYILVATLSCLVTAARCAVWYSIGLKASRNLFRAMTAAIFGAKLLWLEGTSHGEILTRFTSDMNAVDERLSHGVGYMIESVAKLLSILFTRCVASSSPKAFLALTWL